MWSLSGCLEPSCWCRVGVGCARTHALVGRPVGVSVQQRLRGLTNEQAQCCLTQQETPYTIQRHTLTHPDRAAGHQRCSAQHPPRLEDHQGHIAAHTPMIGPAWQGRAAVGGGSGNPLVLQETDTQHRSSRGTGLSGPVRGCPGQRCRGSLAARRDKSNTFARYRVQSTINQSPALNVPKILGPRKLLAALRDLHRRRSRGTHPAAHPRASRARPFHGTPVCESQHVASSDRKETAAGAHVGSQAPGAAAPAHTS